MTTRVYLALLALLAFERLRELRRSRRNTRRLLAEGAVEYGRRHYPIMVALHSLLFVACIAERLIRQPVTPPLVSGAALLGLAGAHALRRAAVRALGGRWTTRVIVLPRAPLVSRGPYRYLRHPNYLAVAVEVACIPLAGGCVVTAVLFSAANALLLRARIAVEERALGLAHAHA